MKMTIAIVDDLESDRETMRREILTFCRERKQHDVTVKSYAGADEILADFAYEVFDVVFLDIRMEGVNGIELAGRLRAADAALLIIFLTTSKEYAFEAFPVHPFDYLIKPCSYDRLCGVMEEVLRTRSAPEPEITVKVPYGEIQIPLAGIVSVQSDGHAVNFHTDDGQSTRGIMTFAQMVSLLENAVYAVQSLSPESRKITVISKMLSAAMLGISVENPYDGTIVKNKEGWPISSRPEHGVGLNSVAATVHSYNGTLEITTDNHIFCVNIILYASLD